MAKILLLYSTTDGHTIQICDRIKGVLEGEGNTVEMRDLKIEPDLQQGAFDKIVIGASIRYGKHQPLVKEFIDRNQSILEQLPNALFSVNVVARKPEKNTPETNPYLQKFLKKLDWKPHEKSFSLHDLAAHLAEVPHWTGVTINMDVFDLDEPYERDVRVLHYLEVLKNDIGWEALRERVVKSPISSAGEQFKAVATCTSTSTETLPSPYSRLARWRSETPVASARDLRVVPLRSRRAAAPER